MTDLKMTEESTEEGENEIIQTHVLIGIDPDFKSVDRKEWDSLKDHFCGVVISEISNLKTSLIEWPKTRLLYLAGNIEQMYIETNISEKKELIMVIDEFSYNHKEEYGFQAIHIGEVPINVHNIGIFLREVFSHDENYFDLISTEHKFQTLTESNKPSQAFRTGIYLTFVEQNAQEDINFNLLRCSTNFDGPTENFRPTDLKILSKVNQINEFFYKDKTVKFNHVLAQIYHNNSLGINQGEKSKNQAAFRQNKGYAQKWINSFLYIL